MYLFFTILFITSCKSSNDNIYYFDPIRIKETGILLSEIADDIIYVPLDNTIPIDFIASYKLVDDIFYVTTKKYGLLTFSREGKFIRTIGKVGRGPGEYLACLSFTIDNRLEKIYILDLHQEIKVFSTSGDFIKNIPLNVYGDNFSKIEFSESKLFLFEFFTMGNAKYNWIIIDTTGILLNQKMNSVPSFKSNMIGVGGIYKSDDKICYWNNYNDSVFSISSDFNYKTSFVINPGSFRLLKANIGPEQLSQYFFPLNIFETNRYLVLDYKFKDKGKLTMVNKLNKKTMSASYTFTVKNHVGSYSGGFLNDIDGGIMLMPTGYCSDQNCLLGTIEPYQVKSLMGTEQFKNYIPKKPEKKKELEKLANAIDENANPILMLVKLKQ